MLESILNVIKKERNFIKISSFISQNLTLCDEHCCNEGYFSSQQYYYKLTHGLFIICSTSFDYFGNTSCGGYFVYLRTVDSKNRDCENIDSLESMENQYTLFKKEGATNGEECSFETTIFDEETKKKVLELYREENEYNLMTFEQLVENSFDIVIPYWKNLSKEDSTKLSTIAALMSYVYDRADGKTKDIYSYNAISPYGGLDITYFPSSTGECFFDDMYKLFPFFGWSHKEFNTLLFDYIEEKDANDCFLMNATAYNLVAKDILQNAIELENVIKSYIRAERRASYFMKKKEELQKDIEQETIKLINSQYDVLYFINELNSFPVYRLFDKILKHSLYRKELKRKEDLKENLFFSKLEIEECKKKICSYTRTYSNVVTKIAKYSAMANNKTYSKWAKLFFDTMYGETGIDTYMELFVSGDVDSIPSYKFRNFINTMKKKCT